MLVDRLADAAEVGLEFEPCTLLGGELEDLIVERLENLDRAMDGFDVEVVLMALFFATVECLLIDVLLVGNETSIFALEGRLRDPLVVEH